MKRWCWLWNAQGVAVDIGGKRIEQHNIALSDAISTHRRLNPNRLPRFNGQRDGVDGSVVLKHEFVGANLLPSELPVAKTGW